MTRVKICGLRTPETVEAAVSAGARYLGFVFFPKSPRHVSIDQARALAMPVPAGVAKVGLFVEPDDDLLQQVLDTVPLDIVQLHGRESAERVRAVKRLTGLPVMKAVGLAEAADLAQIDAYSDVADMILVDAKPPKGAALPGGNGVQFDWRLLDGFAWRRPWMLAGGLTAENVRDAVALTGAPIVDLSGGVERAPGEKDPELIRAFMKAVA